MDSFAALNTQDVLAAVGLVLAFGVGVISGLLS